MLPRRHRHRLRPFLMVALSTLIPTFSTSANTIVKTTIFGRPVFMDVVDLARGGNKVRKLQGSAGSGSSAYYTWVYSPVCTAHF